MKKVLKVLLLFGACYTLLGHVPEVSAQPSPSRRVSGGGGNFGLGVTLAGPTGISAKLFLAPQHALQFQLAWLPFYHHGMAFTFDYLWHPATLVTSSVLNLVPYVGPGLGIAFWDDRHGTESGLMLRILGGLAIHWRKVPLDTVLELGWTPFLVFDNNDFGPAHWDVSIKVRYYF
ncbi:MAG: hypothetical protein JRH20_17190 [Deltaproteobacteria bacterium]|nr:hypothetical protein [Deltaproteobacteria bacterium]